MAPVTGTSSNDVLTFQGSLQQVSGTYVNPYSGLTINLNDVYNVNQITYDGLAGIDLLNMSPQGDFLSLNDGSGNPTITGVEAIVAGAGGDVILLSDATLQLGDMAVSGGDSNDIIWGNVGNDSVHGGNGDDLIAGGPGNDDIQGQNGADTLYGWTGADNLDGGADNDTLYGGAGNDHMLGGTGDDTLYGDDGPNSNPNDYTHTETYSHDFTGAVYGVSLPHVDHVYIPPGNEAVSAANVSIDYSTTITATYVYSEASYADSLGFYRIGTDGSIHDVDLVMKNQHQTAYGDSFTYSYNGEAGDTLGMFMVANGYNTSAAFRNTDLNDGTLSFLYHFGQGDQRTANVHDSAADVNLVFHDTVSGTDTAYSMNIYHSSLSGGASTLNPDGIAHMVSGLASANDPGDLRVGFEDLYYLGDADFDDVVFDIHVASQNMEILGAPDNDYLAGGDGNDVLYGGFGNDVLVGGNGADHLYGGDGSDIFAFDVIDAQPDTIEDFQAGPGGDEINLSNLLTGYDPLTSAIDDFVHLTHTGSNDVLAVNANGAPGGEFHTLATIVGGTGAADAAALLAEGGLVLDHNVVV